ncbi:MAG TPA: MotA/TolQ/ExbB proton channel family protein [Acidimicrobiales bacterium]|nr:MotA/TolQ/ExbB proton channel family protein [Acidimicrobiales bacterium]
MTPVGILVSLVAVIASMIMDHGQLTSLLNAPSLLLVIGGSLGASIGGFELRQLRTIPRAVLIAVGPNKGPDIRETIDSLIMIAKEVRSNPLILEQFATDDAFMKKGIELITSTSDPERVSDLMNAEIEGLQARHRVAAKFFTDMGGYSPTFGILGTVIGLIGVLGQLTSPGKLGPAIAVAFTATLWGVLLANAVWLPISHKLRRLSEEEVTYRAMVVEGLLTMQLNVSTTELRDRLETFLAPSDRGREIARSSLGEATDAAA